MNKPGKPKTVSKSRQKTNKLFNMKKLFFTAVLLSSITSNACIGNITNPSLFNAEGTFLSSGNAWQIATSGDGWIHYTVYDKRTGMEVLDRIMTFSEAVYYTNLFHAQGHGLGGSC